MKYIYSTLAAGVSYTLYDYKTVEGMPVAVKKLHIKGGANVAHPLAMNSVGEIITPKGVVTIIEDEDYDLLKDDYHFKEHIRHGFITVEGSNIKIEKAVSGMKDRDVSAPKIPKDYEEQLKKAEDPDEVAVPKGVRKKGD